MFTPQDIKSIRKFDQSQNALNEQLDLLRQVANRLGLYDAADHIGKITRN